MEHSEEHVKNTVDSHLDMDITNLHVFDGALEVLENLKNLGHTLAICSNTNVRKKHEKYFSVFGFDKFFDHIALSCDLGVKKPHPKMVEVVLEQFPHFEKD